MPKENHLNNIVMNSDTESAIRQLDPKIQSPVRYLATTKIKQILTSNVYNTLHKRLQYNINQVKEILHKNNLTIVRADKNEAMAIIQTDILEQKINTSLQENHITLLKEDPTETFQKWIQQALQTCNLLIERDRLKYLINIKPKAPNLNAYIKTRKEGAPFRPVINSQDAPSYKNAKLLNKKLQNLVKLPNTFITKNSHEGAQDVLNIQLHSNNRLISLDIKDLFTKLPIKNILHITGF